MWNMVTLDGFFEGEKPWDLSFHNLVWGEELESLSIEQLESADMLIFGRNTYEGMASYWSKEKGKVADRMNRIKKFVCSSTLKTADWNNTTIIKDTVVQIQKLKEQGDGNMLVFGSAMLSNSLIKANLFDEYRLCVAPVILGKGRRLFADDLKYQQLSLLETKPLSTGGVILRYIVKDAKGINHLS